LSICREIGDREGEGWVLAYLGLLSHHQDDRESAQRYCQQALLIAQSLGARHTQAYALTHLGHVQMSLGQVAEADRAYRQALTLRHELGEHTLAMEPLAGLARVALAQGGASLAQVEEILSCLQDSPSLDGTDEPFRIYLTCYRVLRAADDPRAEQILNAAYQLIQERTKKIEDQALRRSYLENVPYHREIVGEFRRVHDRDE
jgi:tetratricopeptide (TPR) repeat protein